MALVKLTNEQLDAYIEEIQEYTGGGNAATNAKLDPNANVTHKSVISLKNEMAKSLLVQTHDRMMTEKLEELFPGEGLGKEYLRQLADNEIYCHDRAGGALAPYCASISLYPYLKNGLHTMDGLTQAPKHLHSFCGGYINLLTMIANQIKGAVGTVGLLNAFDHFARRDYGDNYLETNEQEINDNIQFLLYMLNQPTRGGNQCVFSNVSIFDKEYFEGIYGDFVFPNGDTPNWETLSKLQEHFLNFYNAQRKVAKGPLTFPVITACLLTENEEIKDKEVLEYVSRELHEGNNFFLYTSDNVDSLSSCCRLKNEIVDNTFSYTLGAGGVSTGSINVITINMNRMVQIGNNLEEQLDKIYKYQVAYRKNLDTYIEAGMLPIYSEGYVHPSKQYLTIGVNGFVEAAEYLGMDISYNQEYKEFCHSITKLINKKNKAAKARYGYMFNTEYIPGESASVKMAAYDKKAGLKVNRDCYNSYFFKVEDHGLSITDKMKMHGKEFVEFLDGGSACHVNLEELPTQSQIKQLINNCAKIGTNYIVFNVPVIWCEDCNNRDEVHTETCRKCGSTNISHEVRIIGYLRKTSNFSKGRYEEFGRRVFGQV